MKLLVDAIQMFVIAALVYPMFYLWDINKVDRFCNQIEKGTTKQEFLQHAALQSVKIIEPTDDGILGKWNSSAVTWSPFTNHSCEVRGFGSAVFDAWIESV